MKNKVHLLFLSFLCLYPSLAFLPIITKIWFSSVDDNYFVQIQEKQLNYFQMIAGDIHDEHRFRPFFWIIKFSQQQFCQLNPGYWHLMNLLIFWLTAIILIIYLDQKIKLPTIITVLASWIILYNQGMTASWIGIVPQEAIANLLLVLALSSSNKKITLINLFFMALTKENYFLLIPGILLFKYQKKPLLFTSLAFLLTIPFIFKANFHTAFAFLHNTLNFSQSLQLVVLISIYYLIVNFHKKHHLKPTQAKIHFLSLITILIPQIFIYSNIPYLADRHTSPSIILIIIIIFSAATQLFKKNNIFNLILFFTISILFLNTQFRTSLQFSYSEYANTNIFRNVIIKSQDTKIPIILAADFSQYSTQLYSFKLFSDYYYPKQKIFFLPLKTDNFYTDPVDCTNYLDGVFPSKNRIDKLPVNSKFNVITFSPSGYHFIQNELQNDKTQEINISSNIDKFGLIKQLNLNLYYWPDFKLISVNP